ncbi:MAG: hypothetical protein GYB33_11245 [Gammaproteobacteria bacterium]|nr:hypothetical protein [Gammaproteobacteria bacterium]
MQGWGCAHCFLDHLLFEYCGIHKDALANIASFIKDINNCLGVINDASRQEYLRIVNELAESGAESVILGCTEIGMLISQQRTSVRLCDTTAIHAAKAVEWAI